MRSVVLSMNEVISLWNLRKMQKKQKQLHKAQKAKTGAIIFY